MKHPNKSQDNFDTTNLKSKHIKKINGLLNKSGKVKNEDKRPPLGKGGIKKKKESSFKQKQQILKKNKTQSKETQVHPNNFTNGKVNKQAKIIPKETDRQDPKEPPLNKDPSVQKDNKKLSKNQKKKARKRAFAEGSNSNTNKGNKKQKVDHPKQEESKVSSQKNKKNNKNKPKQQKGTTVQENQSKSKGKFDSLKMPGLVKGGDFDHNLNENDSYWNQQLQCNGFVKKSKVKKSAELNEDDPYNYSDLDENDMGDDPYDYSNLEGDDPYDYSDFSDNDEEERYSDFDEDDYEEDDDSYDYSSDDSEFSSQYEDSDDNSENFYDFNENRDDEEDQDYKLPDNVPEDLIVHSGTATKRDLLPEDNVQFKDKNYVQIVELKHQQEVKVIRQPKEYQRNELLKLKFKENPNLTSVKRISSELDDCPKLVPIVDEDGFQLYNPEEDEEEDEEEEEEQDYSMDEDDEMLSLGSEYSEVNSDDADSLLSQDINDKYLNRDIDFSSDEETFLKVSKQKVDIIDATKCEYKGRGIAPIDEENLETKHSTTHMLSKHIKIGSNAEVITIPVMDKKYIEKYEGTETKSEKNSDELKTDKNTNTEEFSNDTPDNGEMEVEDLFLNESDVTEKSDPMKSLDYKAELNLNSIDTSKQSKPSANRLKNTAPSALNDYGTIFCNAINAHIVIVLLKDPFYLYGTARLTLLAGTVEIYGHKLEKDNEVELFSPRGCSEIEISAKETSKSNSISPEKLKQILKKYETNFLKNDLETIAKSFDPQQNAIVLLKRNEERKKIVQQFKKFMNENVFPNMQNITMDRPLYDSEYLLRCMINISATEHKCLRLPEQWQQLPVANYSRIMLVGGKGVGKSTLLRYLINKHLSVRGKVLLIDLDIGQPEIFVPQTVSCAIVDKPLLGPGFFLNIQPKKAFAVGNTNIALCPHKYVAAVRNLINYCVTTEEYQNIPWFVNTMGYNKGFGPELISVITGELPLTDVIQIQSNRTINNFESLLYPRVVAQMPRNMFVEDIANMSGENKKLNYKLHIWQSAVTQESRYQKEWYMSPKDMRYSIMLTRLSEVLQGHNEWLSDCKPMSAPLDQLKFVNLVDNIPSCSSDELVKAMEANLVYLCHYENDYNPLECLGIGVVRAIDFHVQQLYILPAISSISQLKKVNCLALGEMPLPSSLFINQGSRVQKTAPFVYNTIEANASKAIKQIYYRPTKFLKSKHKALD